MKLKIERSEVSGSIAVPGSKSHTIRALFIASLADGYSQIYAPLISEDTMAAAGALRQFGAEINTIDRGIEVKGFAAEPLVPADVIDVRNSGTTLRFAVSVAALTDGWAVLTGDEQLRSRPMSPLLDALNNLGANAFSTRGNGRAPVVAGGKMRGGVTELDAVTSQYLSSLLITAPMLEEDTEIKVTRLNEVPYVEMTAKWLKDTGIELTYESYKRFYIKGGQQYTTFCKAIPGDFSSATFFAVLSAISGCVLKLENLDMNDTQGDRRVFSLLEEMEADVKYGQNAITVKGGCLKGIDADLNSIPDALPALAVAGCFADGRTRLYNVPQARFKETDRIAVMCRELRKMGADIQELSDGLIIEKSELSGCTVDSHGDHRIAMALAVAALNCRGKTVMEGAEAVSITFPQFFELLKENGAALELQKSR